MTQSKIISAKMRHVRYVAERMRTADYNEIVAMGGDPAESLVNTFRQAMFAWVLLIDNTPAAVFGVNSESYLSKTAVPWMITTDLVEKHKLLFLRLCRSFFAKNYGAFAHMVNVIDDRHTVAKRWLEWMGFTLGPPHPFGPWGLAFRTFEIRRDHVR